MCGAQNRLMIAEVHQRAREHAAQLAEALLGEDEAQVVQVGVVSDAGNRNRLRTDELDREITMKGRVLTVARSA